MKSNSKNIQNAISQKYKERIASLCADTAIAQEQVTQERVAQEIAIMLEKADVQEEIDRLESHITQFSDLLKSKPQGRTLDFLLQEMLREVNTLSSKIPDAKTRQACVSAKQTLEQLKEQVQNLE